jgi:hypothetical protein
MRRNDFGDSCGLRGRDDLPGQAQAQQPAPPGAPRRPVPDQMPFDIPYGNSITADRAAES